ncbi:MOSC domain-containing protein [Oleiharenicola lentus]|jgi:uncharacterized protein YcbX|uniref:MOSC domain-containing protein n=1 Tax=Oleiharenicola lentus TaxID=2508720 RepID=A0A4Q1C4G0_9BACT|nr:MOSC N-terminal beta barrel domain-containing protein [Oleiharenicola lentus]RXK53298.1 MOSC domain-containing protein [Oleiharenicola lentus]
MHVAGLFIYPVKSLRGCAVSSVELDALGFAGDRRFLVIGADGQMLTQRGVTRMALVGTALAGGTLTLTADGAGRVSVPTVSDPTAPLHTVAVWKHAGLQAEDCGDAAAAWLGDVLGLTCRLVRIGEKFLRPVTKKAGRPGDVFSFADGSPVLVTSEASLADLNDRIQENQGEPVPMDRFRPNLVLADCAAFAEDTFPHLRIGDVTLRAAGKSDRCIMTTTDQRTGLRGKEPLRTLATFRRDPALDPTAVWFGANFINESKSGKIHVGDRVSTA